MSATPESATAMKMIYRQDEALLQWLTQRIGVRALAADARAIGLANEAGEVVVVIGYDRFTDGDCCAHIAYEKDKGEIPPAFWTAVYAFPFIQLDLARVTSLIRTDNLPAIAFCMRQGFSLEGRIRKGDIDCDMLLLGMLREECPFLPPPNTITTEDTTHG